MLPQLSLFLSLVQFSLLVVALVLALLVVLPSLLQQYKTQFLFFLSIARPFFPFPRSPFFFSSSVGLASLLAVSLVGEFEAGGGGHTSAISASVTMPQELTTRQWRALASVYHLYTANTGCGEAEQLSAGWDKGGAMTLEEEEEEEKALQWVEGVLPLLQRAFPPAFLAGVKQQRQCDNSNCTYPSRQRRQGKRQRQSNGGVGTSVRHWRQLIPAEIDKFISNLLQLDAGDRRTSLTSGERSLLQLLNKEQRWADCCFQRHAALQELVRQAGEKLIRMVMEDNSGNDGPDNLVLSTEKNSGPRKGADLAPQGHHKRSRMDRMGNLQDNKLVEVEDDGDKDENKGEVAGDAELYPTPKVSSKHQSTFSPTSIQGAKAKTKEALKISKSGTIEDECFDLTCVGCGDRGGEVFRCRHCHLLRHEACGGPKVDSETGFCDVCCHELGLSVSNSSLRSSTSTEERAELDNEDDDDTSLSGFIVRTSDEDEDEGDDEVNSCGTSSSSES